MTYLFLNKQQFFNPFAKLALKWQNYKNTSLTYCQRSRGYLELSKYVFYFISYRCRTSPKLADQKRGLFEDCMLINVPLLALFLH